MTSVLFVCTGNIFRSVTAEYALRARLSSQSGITVSSAGTMHAPDARVRNDVADYLAAKQLDVSRHQRRTLSKNMLRRTDLVIAMSTDHKDLLEREYDYQSTLFMGACGLGARPLLDVDDLFAPEDRHSGAAQRHIFQIIDQIIDVVPVLAAKLETNSS